MKIGNMFRAAALTITMGLATQNAEAQEITVTFPNGKTAQFDCSLLHVENGQVWMTEEAIHALDRAYGGVSISSNGLTGKDELSSDPKIRGQQLSNNLYLFMVHLGRQHKNCISQIAGYEEKKGLNVDEIYGEGWENRTDCIIVDITKGCKSEMGL